MLDCGKFMLDSPSEKSYLCFIISFVYEYILTLDKRPPPNYWNDRKETLCTDLQGERLTHDNTKGGILGRDNVLGQVWDLFDMYIGCKHLRWKNEPRLMDSVGEDRRSGRDRKNAWGHYSSSLASVIIITILIIITTWRFVLSNYFS